MVSRCSYYSYFASFAIHTMNYDSPFTSKPHKLFHYDRWIADKIDILLCHTASTYCMFVQDNTALSKLVSAQTATLTVDQD